MLEEVASVALLEVSLKALAKHNWTRLRLSMLVLPKPV
jgi:hypothetical protein